jgi:hypothetical protein
MVSDMVSGFQIRPILYGHSHAFFAIERERDLSSIDKEARADVTNRECIWLVDQRIGLFICC